MTCVLLINAHQKTVEDHIGTNLIKMQPMYI